MNISFAILVAVLHVYMASAEPLPARNAHAMTVVQRRRSYQGSGPFTSEEYQSGEINQEEEEDEWNESKEQNYSEHESKDSNDFKTLEAKHSNETNNENVNDKKHHTHEMGHLAENIEKPCNYTKEMESALDLTDPREISEVLYELTGFKDETMVIAYCKTTAGLKTDEEAYNFLMSCGGARGNKFVIRLLKKLSGSANIKAIVQLVKIITGEDCVTPGFKIIQSLTGHNDIDGIIEVLQRISGRNSISDLIDFFEHNENHTTGLDGISHQIYKLTGGGGSKEFPGVFEALKSEVDWTATFNILITVMRSNDISEAIVELKKLIGTNSFPAAIDVMKLATEQTHFRYALEAFLEETGRVNLKSVIKTLYQLSGKSDLMSVLRELQRLYKINNIIKVFQTVNKISKKRDPLVVLSNLLDLTGAANLSDCSAVFTGLTFKQMTALEVINQIQIETGCTDLVEFLRGMLTVTGSRNLLKSWKIIVGVTQKNDIFELINTLKKYTNVDLITVFQLLQRITNTINIVPAVDKINELLEIRGFFEWFEVLHHVVEIDVIVFLEGFTSLSTRSLLEVAIDITMHYTDIYEPIPAIADLKDATQQEDIFKAIEYVKSKKSRHNNTITTTTTTTTTLTPSTSQESTSDTTSESIPETTSESIPETTSESTHEPITDHQPETTSGNPQTTTEQISETATVHTSEQSPEVTTEAITTTELLPQTTAEPTTETVSEATTESKPDSTTTPTTEVTVEPTTVERTPVSTTEVTMEEAASPTNDQTVHIIAIVENQQAPTNSSELNKPVDQESNPNQHSETLHLIHQSDDKQTPEIPITEAPKDQDQKDLDKSKTIRQDDNVVVTTETPATVAPVQIETTPQPTSNDKKDDQPTSDKPISTDQVQPAQNDKKDLNDKPNPSNPQDTKSIPEKETPVTSETEHPVDLSTTENPTFKNISNGTDSPSAVPRDQSNTVKQITIIVHTVPEESPNKEKPVDKPTEGNAPSSTPNIETLTDKKTTPTEAPEPTSNPTKALPSETTGKPIEDITPSDLPEETSPPDKKPNTELSTENPTTEATIQPSVVPVEQTPSNDIPTTEQPEHVTTQGTPGTENLPCTQDTPRTTETESPATNKPVENSSPANDNPSSTQPSEPKSEVPSTSTPTTSQPEHGPVSTPDSKEVKPEPQALQVNMNLKLLILPKGPKNTKNCYCACESQDPPKLIPMKQLPLGITNEN